MNNIKMKNEIQNNLKEHLNIIATKYEVFIKQNGSTFWYLNDKLHRENGPAIEQSVGIKQYWLNGQLHRLDGPAVEYLDGSVEYWINDEQLTEEEFNNRHIKEMTINEIQALLGYKIKIIA